MYFYEPKHNNSSMMTLSNSSIVFVRLEEIEWLGQLFSLTGPFQFSVVSKELNLKCC